MQAFMRQLDIDYDASFTCPVCIELPHDQQVFIADGKSMGLNKATFKDYVPPVNGTCRIKEPM
jgi:hypothetical protein